MVRSVALAQGFCLGSLEDIIEEDSYPSALFRAVISLLNSNNENMMEGSKCAVILECPNLALKSGRCSLRSKQDCRLGWSSAPRSKTSPHEWHSPIPIYSGMAEPFARKMEEIC